MNFKQYLEEGRDAPLYHGTSVDLAQNILKHNTLSAITHHRHIKNNKRDKSIKVISLSRNISFVLKWMKRRFDSYDPFVIFELDQRRLSQKYKIIPYNHFGDNQYFDGKAAARQQNDLYKIDFPINQYEENVIGDIKTFNRYLTKIMVKDHKDHNFVLDSKELKNHPLLYCMKEKRFVNVEI
jgi:hypothetical protein